MNKQPSSKQCFVCGVDNPVGLHMSFFDKEPGVVEALYTVPEHFQGYPGITHGGVISAMLDEVAGRAQMSSAPSGFMVTAQLNVRYRKPVPVGQPLRLVGKAGTRKGRVSTASGEIFGPDGSLLAEAELILVDIPQEEVEKLNPEAFGWRVYPGEQETR